MTFNGEIVVWLWWALKIGGALLLALVASEVFLYCFFSPRPPGPDGPAFTQLLLRPLLRWWRNWRYRPSLLRGLKGPRRWWQKRQHTRQTAAATRRVAPDGTVLAPVQGKNWSADLQAARWEGRFGQFPHPTNAQHLTSYAALRALGTALGKSLLTLSTNTLYFAVLWYLVLHLTYTLGGYVGWWNLAHLTWREVGLWGGLWLLGALWNLPVLARVQKNWQAYFAPPRDTHGTARWAKQVELNQADRTYLWTFDPAQFKPLAEVPAASAATGGPPPPPPNARDERRRYLHAAGRKFRWECRLESLVRRSTGTLPVDPIRHGYLPIGPFGRTRWLCLPLETVARHLCIMGPPGSGKSASFLIAQIRYFAWLGSAVVLDIKGEIYKYTARYYRQAFRIDLVAPESSDRMLLGPLCYRDKTRALEIGSLIIGFDPNKQNSENPFWPQSATILLTCLLLHMAEDNLYFTPRDIFTFLEVNKYNEDAETAEARDPLTHRLMNSTQAVREAYVPFTQLDGKTKSNVVISMVASLKDFMDPAVENLFTLPTPEETARGCRVIDPVQLRKLGTAIYVIVPEGRASQLANALGTIFGTLSNTLRRTGDPDDFRAFLDFHAPLYVPPGTKLRLIGQAAHALLTSQQMPLTPELRDLLSHITDLTPHPAPHAAESDLPPAALDDQAAVPEELLTAQRDLLKLLADAMSPAWAQLARRACVEWYIRTQDLAAVIADPGFCLMQFDEAGNVPLRNLSEDVGVGRGRRMPYNLGWQNKEQPAKQYGNDYAQALMQSIGLKLFLPGLNSTTAHWVTELLGKTTAISRSTDDAVDDRLDSQRISEVQRDLVSETELRQLPAYTQAVFVMTDLPPVRLSFPANAKAVDAQTAPVPCYRAPAYQTSASVTAFVTGVQSGTAGTADCDWSGLLATLTGPPQTETARSANDAPGTPPTATVGVPGAVPVPDAPPVLLTPAAQQAAQQLQDFFQTHWVRPTAQAAYQTAQAVVATGAETAPPAIPTETAEQGQEQEQEAAPAASFQRISFGATPPPAPPEAPNRATAGEREARPPAPPNVTEVTDTTGDLLFLLQSPLSPHQARATDGGATDG